MQQPKPKRRKKLLFRLAATFGTLALGLCVGELVLRLTGLGRATLTRGALHAYDPDAGWSGAPNLDTHYVLPESFDVRVVDNSRGLRGPEHEERKPSGVRRVAVLGDSFMWGFGVENEEMTASVIERELGHTESICLAANGYSTVQELVRLETEGLRYAPDWTILAFTWNDLEDNFDDKHGGRPVAALTDAGQLELRNRPVRRAWKNTLKQWLRHHSRLFAVAEYSTALVRARARESADERDESGTQAPAPGVAPPAAVFDPSHFGSLGVLDVYGPPTARSEFAWRVFGLLLARIHEVAGRGGGRLLVVYNASQELVVPAVREATFARFAGEPERRVDPARPMARLAELCRAEGIEFLDLTPVFVRQQEPRERLYLRKNGHWSAEGHALAGRAIARRIRELEPGVRH